MCKQGAEAFRDEVTDPRSPSLDKAVSLGLPTNPGIRVEGARSSGLADSRKGGGPRRAPTPPLHRGPRVGASCPPRLPPRPRLAVRARTGRSPDFGG